MLKPAEIVVLFLTALPVLALVGFLYYLVAGLRRLNSRLEELEARVLHLQRPHDEGGF